MRRPSRLLVLRLVSLVGLGFGALLTAEALRPGRKFCPVDEACAAARSSALGSVLGIPTSLLGLLAFAGFLALLFVPRAQRGWRPAGALAALAGIGFLAYQAFALDAFCPLCVVVDLTGIALGVLTFVGDPVPAAPASPRTWIPFAAAAALLIALPLAWPRTARLAWSAIPAPAPGAADPASPGAGSTDTGSPPTGSPAAAPRISLVEYLNPFCAHCRATHARLAHVLEEVRTPVERVRLYTWSGKTPPLWAKACVCAHDQGGGTDLERPFFRELMQARSDRPAEIWAAAERAGLDVSALAACVNRGDADERLGRVYARVKAATITGLPTLDLGRRRLEGEQTEEELREAVTAAEADLRSRPGG